MPILNYTTEIDAHRTVSEIQKILVSHGAMGIMIEYDQQQPVALSFTIPFEDDRIPFRLPCRHRQLLALLQTSQNSNLRPKHRTEGHALKVAWRIMKDWCEAQVALVEVGMVDMAEVFLPYALTAGGDTFYEQYKRNAGLLEAE